MAAQIQPVARDDGRWLGWRGAYMLNALVVCTMATAGLGFGGYRCDALLPCRCACSHEMHQAAWLLGLGARAFVVLTARSIAMPHHFWQQLTCSRPHHTPALAFSRGLAGHCGDCSSVVALIDAINSFGVFAACYDC